MRPLATVHAFEPRRSTAPPLDFAGDPNAVAAVAEAARFAHGASSTRRVRLREMTGMPNPKVAALVSAIRAGEDTELELKEVVFRGDRLSFAAEEGRAASKLAEVFVSMANTRGGTIVMGVRDSDRAVVGIDPEKRDLLERFVVDVATTNCVPMIGEATKLTIFAARHDAP